MSQVQLTCGFCLAERQVETKSSKYLRITTLVIGILAVAFGITFLFNAIDIGRFSATIGWTSIACGSLLTLLGFAVRCVDKSKAQTSKAAEPRSHDARTSAPITLSQVKHKNNQLWIGKDEHAEADLIVSCHLNDICRAQTFTAFQRIWNGPSKEVKYFVRSNESFGREGAAVEADGNIHYNLQGPKLLERIDQALQKGGKILFKTPPGFGRKLDFQIAIPLVDYYTLKGDSFESICRKLSSFGIAFPENFAYLESWHRPKKAS